MNEVIQILHMLLVSPKKATSTLQYLSLNQPRLLQMLAEIVVRNQQQKIRIPALTSLTSISLRKIRHTELNNLGTLDDIYEAIKMVFFCPTLPFSQKKIIVPCLAAFLEQFTVVITEVKELKQEIHRSYLPELFLILMEAVLLASVKEKVIKLEMITEIASESTDYAEETLIFLLKQCENVASIDKAIFRQAMAKVQQWLNNLSSVVNIFKQVNQPFEYEAMQYVYQNQKLAKMLVSLLLWEDKNNELKFPWIQNIEGNESIAEDYEVNKMKSTAFKIINGILSKTETTFNIFHTEFYLMQSLPKICELVIADLLTIGPSFNYYCSQFCLGSLCDKMHRFLANCSQFKDLKSLFFLRSEEIRNLIFPYLDRRPYESQMFQNQPIDFMAYLEELLNCEEEELSKSGLVKLINILYINLDGFSTFFFQACYDSFINNLNCQRKGENKKSQFNLNSEICLYGFLVISGKLLNRTDFTYAMKKMFAQINLEYLTIVEKTIFYKVLSALKAVFLDTTFLKNCKNLILSIFQVDEEDQTCYMSAMDLFKEFFLLEVDSEELQHFIEEALWGRIKEKAEFCKNYYFFEILTEIIKKLMIGPQTKQFMLELMKISSKRLLRQYEKQFYDEYLSVKIFNLMISCVEELLQVWLTEGIQFRDEVMNCLLVYVQKTITCSSYATPETKEGVLIIIGKLLQKKVYIPDRSLEIIRPLLLNKPFISEWLICCCYMILECKEDYSLRELDQLTQIVEVGLDKLEQRREKQINEVFIFCLYFLNLVLPQNWIHLHERIRAHFINCVRKQKQIFPSILIIRMFHIYLFGFKLAPQNQKLQQILPIYFKHLQHYSPFDVFHLIKAVESSFEVFSHQNLISLFSLVVEVLHKLHLSPKHFGKENLEEKQLRQRVNSLQIVMREDPYLMFRQLYQELSGRGYEFLTEENEKKVSELLHVVNIEGEPRRMYSIKRKEL